MPGKSKNKASRPAKHAGRKPNHQRTQAAPRQRAAPRLLGAGGTSDFTRYLKLVKDPWDQPPVRLGGTSNRTALFTMRGRVVVSNPLDPSNANAPSTVFALQAGPEIAACLQISAQAALVGGSMAYGQTGIAYVPSVATVQATYSSVRALGGGLRVRLVSTTANDQGLVAAAVLPNSVSNAITPAQLFEYDGAVTGEIRKGMSVCWRPEDPSDFTFLSSTLTATLPTNGGIGVPTLLIAGTNLIAGFTIEIETIWHYEGTLSTGSIGLIDTDIGKMSVAQQESVLTGDVLSRLGNAASSWLEPVAQGLNDVYQVGGRFAGQAFGYGAVNHIRHRLAGPAQRRLGY